VPLLQRKDYLMNLSKRSILKFRKQPEQDKLHDFVEYKKDAESDPFLNSLDTLTPDDIAPKKLKSKKSKSELVTDIVRKVLLTVCVGVFCVSAASLINSLYNYSKGDEIYDSIAEDFYAFEMMYSSDGAVSLSPTSPKNDATPIFNSADSVDGASDSNITVNKNKYNAEFEKVKAKLNYLAVKNPDIYGWISIANTNIDYPLVQGEDNDYYLHHAYNGEYLTAGAIFVDYRCYESILRNHNTVIYGHNMTNGKMFNNITKFLDKDFFNENKHVVISTPDGIFTYLVFAIYETNMYDNYITTAFPSHEEFVKWAEEMRGRSLYEREGVEFAEDDRVITLSTCTNGHYTKRYTLQALLVDISN